MILIWSVGGADVAPGQELEDAAGLGVERPDEDVEVLRRRRPPWPRSRKRGAFPSSGSNSWNAVIGLRRAPDLVVVPAVEDRGADRAGGARLRGARGGSGGADARRRPAARLATATNKTDVEHGGPEVRIER